MSVAHKIADVGDRALRAVRGMRQRTRAVRRAKLVSEPARFLFWELVPGPQRAACYTRPQSGLTVCLRHHSPDLYGLDQVFLSEVYRPPPRVMDILKAIDRPLRAIDLGANIGLFGVYLRESFPDSYITAFEPDPFNVPVLERCIEANGGRSKWKLIEACASTEDGRLPFEAGRFLESQIAPRGSPSAQSVAAVDVFPHLDGADLVKIDIQGGEWEILADPRFAGIEAAAVALEYHPQLCPHLTPRDAVTRRLEDARYRIAPFKEKAPGLGELWAWRPPY
jgi:FkbM family methyltransferase